jgi:lysophospholipase L1-like esterase
MSPSIIRGLRAGTALTILLANAVASAAEPATWVTSWSTAQQTPEPRNALADEDLTNATLRQSVHLSLGGRTWRLRLSNAFGQAPLRVGAVHVARTVEVGKAAIDPASGTPVLFDGKADVTIPAGADYFSDSFSLGAAPGASLTISVYLPEAPRGQTSHPGSRTTSHLVHGNQAAAPDLTGAKTFEHWFVIGALDVAADANASAVVILGDSIADGRGTTTNANNRWSDNLAARFMAAKMPVAVLNAGIGGNRVLEDGLGPSALARFDRDVLSPSGVRWVIVHEGINDLGTFAGQHSDADHEELVRRIIAAYRQIIDRAHAHGIRVMGATLTPFDGPTYRAGARGEADRAAINAWIRAPGNFDAVVDFDQAVRDPEQPLHLRKDFDTGDNLHLTPKGYLAMADAIPLDLFGRPDP